MTVEFLVSASDIAIIGLIVILRIYFIPMWSGDDGLP